MRVNPELEAACLRLAVNRPTPVEAPPPAFGSEAELQAWVIRYAKARGWLVYHTHESRRSEEGFPDLMLLRDGVQVVAELKFVNGKMSEAQRTWLDAFKQCPGLRVFLWYETDVREIEEVLL